MPLDTLLLLKIHCLKDDAWTMQSLGTDLDVSSSQVHASCKRCHLAGLYSKEERKPVLHNLREFILHAVKYIHPPVFGQASRGIPTAHSAPPLSDQIESGNDLPLIWPTPSGPVRGLVLEPIHRSVPNAAAVDPLLYELLALIDGLRCGRARERKLAASQLEQRLKQHAR
jgi:hypothetical protein